MACTMLFVLLLYTLFMESALFATSAPQDVMELSYSLTPSSNPLFSSSSVFMLSFSSPPSPSSPSSSGSTNLHLSVSFVVNAAATTQPGHIAWTANRDTPVSADASLTLSSTGNLILSDSSSDVWMSNTTGLGVVRAQLLDSGNLVLLNSTSGYVWQSFLYPTDTLLPGQDFTNKSKNLISNMHSNDLSSGKYSFGITSAQELQIFQTDSPTAPYWNISGISSFGFNQLGYITLYNSPSSISRVIVVTDQGVSATRRITLDIDGNLRMYTWDNTSVQWTSVWLAFSDVCTRSRGLCGSYGVCIYNLTQVPTCTCPQGFSVIDPTDLSSGCKANYRIDNCSSSFQYVEMESVNYLGYDDDQVASLSIKECKSRCSKSCACVAAVYTLSDGNCRLKRDLKDGFGTDTQNHRAFLKVSASDLSVSSTPIQDIPVQWSSQNLRQPLNPNQSIITHIMKSHKYFSTVNMALAIMIAIQSMCFAVAVVALISRARRQARYIKLHGEMIEGSPLVCSYEELRAATRNFSQKLGSGGFGTVYKGQLRNGKLVAVKQLEGISQREEKQFRAEIMTIGRIHHINLLRLVGFCADGTHRLLVYEYMEKGSVDQVLFEDSDQPDHIQVLDWSTRFQICLGVARGIHYLHQECLDCILHCDIKPQNILLDGTYCAKVADFGLAYLYTRDDTVKMSTIRGTRGYLAPEWACNLPITSKADVYSYGMLVLEIISGRRNFLYTASAMEEPDGRWCFPMWAYGRRVEELVDPRLEALSSIDLKEAEAAIKVGFACIQADLTARPSIGKVVQMLEGTLCIPEAPPPSLFPPDPPASPVASSITSSTSTSQDRP